MKEKPKYLLLLIILLCKITAGDGQDYSIRLKLAESLPGFCRLAGFRDGKTVFKDSAFMEGGEVGFILKKSYSPGIYRILISVKEMPGFMDNRPASIDFIFNAENITMETSFGNTIEDMKISGSGENEIFYRYLRIEKSFREKFRLLDALLDQYASSDSFYSCLGNEYLGIQQDHLIALTGLMEELPGSVASSVIKTNLFTVMDPSVRGAEIEAFYRAHFFDLIHFTDPRLIHSQVYTGKIIDFLSHFNNPELTPGVQEQEFTGAVDIIMDRASVQPEIYDFVLNFLIDGFDELKMEKVLVHIAENYIEGGCETDNKKLMEKRLEGFMKMAPGKKVADIILLDENGRQVRLSDLKNNYVLVLFWASWCPHCSHLLPQIKKWYGSKSIDMEIFAVSIDSSRFDWEENLMMNSYPWINTCTFEGWNDKATKDYNIYATPTMFLLDRERRIISKPLTFREFRREMERLKGDI